MRRSVILAVSDPGVVHTTVGERREIPLTEIQESTANPRRVFDPIRLEELAATIRERGVLEPIIVRPNPAGSGYEIVAGARRFRAATLAGLTSIPATIRTELNDV